MGIRLGPRSRRRFVNESSVRASAEAIVFAQIGFNYSDAHFCPEVAISPGPRSSRRFVNKSVVNRSVEEIVLSQIGRKFPGIRNFPKRAIFPGIQQPPAIR